MPNPTYQLVPITFDKGVNESIEDSVFPEGVAAELVNLVPEFTGGLRARHGWKKSTTSGQPTSPKGRGCAIISRGKKPYVRQTKSAKSENTSSLNIVFDKATLPGSLLLVLVSHDSSTSVVSVTGFTAVDADKRLWEAINSPSLSSTTVTLSSPQAVVAVFIEIADTGVLDVQASNSDNASPIDVGPITTTQAITIAVCGFSLSGTTSSISFTGDPTPGYTSNVTDSIASGTTRLACRIGTKSIETKGSSVSVSQTFTGSASIARNYLRVYVCDVADQIDDLIVAAHATSTGYEIYTLKANDLTSGTWSLLDTITTSQNEAPVSFAVGTNKLVYTSPGFPSARVWDFISSPTNLTGSATPGRFVVYHKNRFFIGGSLVEPSRLWFSDLGSTNIPAANFVDINKDDGDAIEDAVSAENILLIAKSTSVWALSGSGIDSFFLTKLPGGDAAPGRSMTHTPFGTILAGKKQIWSIQGGSVDPIGRQLYTSYEISSYASTCNIGDIVYICDRDSGTIWAQNLVTGSWWVEKTSSNEDAVGFIYAKRLLQLGMPSGPATNTPFAVYREISSPIREKDFDPLTETLTFTTGKIWLTGPVEVLSPRHLFLQVRQRADGEPVEARSDVMITVKAPNQKQKSFTIKPFDIADVYRFRLDLGPFAGVPWIQIVWTQTLNPLNRTLMEPEKIVLGVEREPNR